MAKVNEDLEKLTKKCDRLKQLICSKGEQSKIAALVCDVKHLGIRLSNIDKVTSRTIITLLVGVDETFRRHGQRLQFSLIIMCSKIWCACETTDPETLVELRY